MTDKEKIKAEIEQVKEIHESNLDKPMERGRIGHAHGYVDCCDEILDFIDSLPEENGQALFEKIAYPGSFEEFIAGLNPPPKIPEMMEEAIDAEIVKDIHNLLHVKSGPLPMPSEYKFGDKVKIVIFKEK